MALRVLLADDHEIVREGLRAILERNHFRVIAEAGNGYEAVQLAKANTPDIAVLDFTMPLLNGIDAARQLRAELPKIKVVLLTMHSEEQYISDALHAGVTGYVLKTEAAEDLVRAVSQVSLGLPYLSPKVSRSVLKAYLENTEIATDPLTPRERQVLQLIAEGETAKGMANLLGISVKTAEAHRARIMQKLEISGTAGLVRYAIRRGLVAS